MWSSSARKKGSRNAVSSSPSNSSSTCLCPRIDLTRKSMEDIFKGINFSTPHLHHHTAAAASNRGRNLQKIRSLPNSVTKPQTRDDSARCGGDTVFLPAPATVLSLSSPGNEVGGTESSDRMRPDPQQQKFANVGSDLSFLSSLNSPFDALSPSADPFPSLCKKRASDNDESSGDFRYSRMIKNRESAIRSRARKQAYAKGLENEVGRLLEENARLRIQVEKYRLAAAAAAQIPKKQTLNRTLTAPF